MCTVYDHNLSGQATMVFPDVVREAPHGFLHHEKRNVPPATSLNLNKLHDHGGGAFLFHHEVYKTCNHDHVMWRPSDVAAGEARRISITAKHRYNRYLV